MPYINENERLVLNDQTAVTAVGKNAKGYLWYAVRTIVFFMRLFHFTSQSTIAQCKVKDYMNMYCKYNKIDPYGNGPHFQQPLKSLHKAGYIKQIGDGLPYKMHMPIKEFYDAVHAGKYKIDPVIFNWFIEHYSVTTNDIEKEKPTYHCKKNKKGIRERASYNMIMTYDYETFIKL